MARHRVRKQYINLPPPPRTPNWCDYEAGMIGKQLVRQHNAHKWQVHYLIGMLHESYLLSLPRLKKDTSSYGDSSPTRLRWLWCAWGAKILGWGEVREEGHPEGFSSDIHTALREKIFPFPKVERDSSGRPLQSPSAGIAICTCTGTLDASERETLQPGSVARQGWLEFLRHKGFIDNDSNIIWGANPAAQLSSWAYEHMLFITGTPNPAAAAAASSSAGGIFAVGEFSTSAMRGSSTDLPQSRPPGCNGGPGDRVPTLPRRRRREAERLLPSITESAGWEGHRPTRRDGTGSGSLDDSLRPSDWPRTAEFPPRAGLASTSTGNDIHLQARIDFDGRNAVCAEGGATTAGAQEQQPRSPA
jgi:hypothetical protein